MMKFGHFKKGLGIRPLKFPVWDAPHITIETNRTCNMRCRSCYNLNRSIVKSFDQVKEEIDLAIVKRNLAMVTLLGGEPTLHPQLAEIVSYIKSKKLICQILTNGLVLLQDERGEFLDRLSAAGVDRILLHIDEGQSHVYGDLEAVRRTLFSKLEKKRIRFSLSLTIYNETQAAIPSLIKKYSAYRYFDGILAVLARDILPPKLQHPELRAEYETIRRELDLEPAAYIPSSLADEDVHWLLYFYFLNAKSGASFAVSPARYRIFAEFYRRARGHQSFSLTIHPRLSGLMSVLVGAAEIVCRPSRIPEWVSLIFHSDWSRALRFQYLAIQTPPELNPEKNQVQLCYHCPDATIRNGRLTPLCLADRMSPFDGDGSLAEPGLFQTVDAHLQEI